MALIRCGRLEGEAAQRVTELLAHAAAKKVFLGEICGRTGRSGRGHEAGGELPSAAGAREANHLGAAQGRPEGPSVEEVWPRSESRWPRKGGPHYDFPMNRYDVTDFLVRVNSQAKAI